MQQFGETVCGGLKIFCTLQGPAQGEPQPTLLLEFQVTNLSRSTIYLDPPFYCRLSANVGKWTELGYDFDFGMARSRSPGIKRYVLERNGETRLYNCFRLGYHGVETVERLREEHKDADIQFLIYGILNAHTDEPSGTHQNHFEITLGVNSGEWEKWMGIWGRERVLIYLSKDVYERLSKIPKTPRDLNWVINELINMYESTHPPT
jgi:hypothetical protein